MWTNEELKMTSVNRKLIYAILDSSQIHTSSSLRSSLVLLLDPENIGIAVGVSLLSSVLAEVYDITYVLAVNGGHV